jgi:hypothetical protein
MSLSGHTTNTANATIEPQLTVFMHRHLSHRRIYPKISTVPRANSEAATFLDIYKLVIEKKRLQQEQERIDRRRQQILDRLLVLEAQVAELEQTAQHQRQESHKEPLNPQISSTETKLVAPKPLPVSSASEPFDTFFLEY